MNRQVPTLGKLLTMVLFALSVFGLTLFMWVTFGGSVPFKAEGYRIKTSFPEATQLAVEADVRIAGVPVGRVKKVAPGGDGRAAVELEIQRRFAPLPTGTEAILRQKTLLGETYVSLTPPNGTLEGKPIPEGGAIPKGDVGETIELDELFQTFDEETRENFQNWMKESGEGLGDQGENAGRALVEFQLLVAELGGLTKTLDEQSPSLRTTLSEGKTVLDAATQQSGALSEAFTQSERVFRQLGDQDAALTALVERLPTFLARTRSGTRAVESFARDTGPAVERLEPTVKALTPAFKSLRDVSPELRQLLVGVERVNNNAKAGLPATTRALRTLPVLLDPLDGFLKEVNPILEYASNYGDDLAATLGNLTSVSQPQTGPATYRDGRPLRMLRGATVLQPEGLSAATERLSTNRANAYRRPGWGGAVLSGLEALSAQSCGDTVPRVVDTDNAQLNEKESVRARQGFPPSVPDLSLLDSIRYSLFAPQGFFLDSPEATTPSVSPAPTTPTAEPYACKLQQPFNIGGRLTTYPQLPAAPTSTAPSVNTGG